MSRVILLLSGGIDSATALYMTKLGTDDICTVNMIYSTSYDAEAEAAKKIAAAAHVRAHVPILLPFFKDIEQGYHPTPSTKYTAAYVPSRNIIFYGVAAAYAETLGASQIVFGSNADDAKELPDARPTFIQLMNELIRTGTRSCQEGSKIEIVNPLINYSKYNVLKLALKLKVPLELTWSCYENGKSPCGKCRGCTKRLEAFNQVGAPDPLFIRGSIDE